MTTKPCVCSWSDCKSLHLNIRELTPASHVWNQSIIRIQFTTTNMEELLLKKYALHQAIIRHLHIQQSVVATTKNIFVAPHHFPISLLTWRLRNGVNSFTNYLSLEDLGNMNCPDHIFQSFREKSNTVVHYMRSKDRQCDTKKYDKLYIQSPIETRHDVNNFFKIREAECNIYFTSSNAN